MNYGRKIKQVKSVDGFGGAMIIQRLLGSGKICRVDYQKKSGEKTTMICRTGVHAHIKGTGKRVTNLEEGIIGVWSFDRGGYRTLKADSILSIKSGDIFYEILKYGQSGLTSFNPEMDGYRTFSAITSPMY